MKNITVTVDDDLYHNARVKAAENRTTVSAMVREFLESVTSEESAFTKLQSEQNQVIKRIRKEHPGFSASSRLTREELHARNALR